jgi:hypothetical protein
MMALALGLLRCGRAQQERAREIAHALREQEKGERDCGSQQERFTKGCYSRQDTKTKQ